MAMTHFTLLDMAKRENKVCKECLNYHQNFVKKYIIDGKEDNEKSKKT